MMQARILRPYTEGFFRRAGISQGMSVLDLGSGMGDVAILAGDIVGPGGRVIGLERARQRTVEQGCSSRVSFLATNLDDFSTTEQFDAVVGRYVLQYQPDAAATLRRLTAFLKPGGIVAFHEVDFTCPHLSFPPCELFDQVVGIVPEVFRRVGLPPDFGRHLGKTFVDAGLPFPTIHAETPVGGARGSSFYSWIAATVVSVTPRLADLGLSLPSGVVADHTLVAKLEKAAVAQGCQIVGSTQFGTWAREPL